ncbi:hypothetical protein [Streptomyces sp. NRRL S-920]|uniref:hypothetical protein n=1 Tax=Streptomyces sp. NRRL S-920 TaxID=1463921 RepID=UPI00068F8C49|nr:hypothetical protein [Streptomyces sp. NRRL S-920]
MTTSFRLDEREQAKNFAAYLAQLERRIQDLERSNSLTNASVDGGSIEVYDEDGSLQVVVGEQGDGTTGVIHVNGPPPPTPSTPTLAEARGGVAATWDGLFTDALSAPLDFSRIEVHASTASVFEPTQITQVGTIESPRGGVFLIPTEVPVHVRFLARTLSGTGGEPSAAAGPVGPGRVVAQDVLDGIISETKLTKAAVTAAKIALGAVNGTHLAAESVTTEKLLSLSVTAEKIASLAITSDKIAALSVTADKIAVNSIDASHIRAGAIDATHIKVGSITADRLTIASSPNMLPDPSFEGPGGAALVAGQTYWSIADGGNGSARAVLVNAASAAPVIRTLSLSTFPILAGQQLHLAVDAMPSTDWTGASVRIYARWIDSAGNVTFGHVTNSNPTRGSWNELSGNVQAPPGTVQAEIRIGSYDATAGTVAFDNAVVQPVLGKVQIADGAVTADKLDAKAIDGKIITGATLRTAATGGRIVMDASRLTAYGHGSQRIVLEPNSTSPFLYFTSDDGTNYAYLQVAGQGSEAALVTHSGKFSDRDGAAVRWRTWQGNDKWVAERVLDGTAVTVGSRIQLTAEQATISGPAIRANGVLRADNIVMGVVKVKPTPNVPTPVTLSGGNIAGSKFRAQLTANTGYPGNRVLGVGFTGLSSEGMTIWVTRTDNDETTVHWQIIGED